MGDASKSVHSLSLSCPFTGMLLGNSRVITVAAKQKQDNINHMNEGTSPFLATPLSLSNHGGEIGMS